MTIEIENENIKTT